MDTTNSNPVKNDTTETESVPALSQSPLLNAATSAGAVVAQSSDDASKKRILVVDDEQDAKDLFAELLRTNPNYIIDTASDGHEALEKCAATKFDLVLLDIVMPNLDGVDTLSQIKMDPTKYGSPIVIMLTNIGGDIAIQEALKLGAVGYKLKIDTEPDELLETVAKALEAKSSTLITAQSTQTVV